MLLTAVFLVLLLLPAVIAKRHRKNIEVGVVNMADANIRLRCQSVLVDYRDHFLGPMSQFRFSFVDFDRGNHHFWCDSYGLFGFLKTFDVFGRAAPSRTNITWFIKQDGLYMDGEQKRLIEWFWNFPPLASYVQESRLI